MSQDHQQRQAFAQHQQAQRQAFEQHARASAAAARTAALQVAVLSSIEDFARSRPDFDRLEAQMVHALQTGRVRRTGHAARDLEVAYRHVGGDYA